MSPLSKNTVDLDRERISRSGEEIPSASPEVLKRLGLSKYRWNRMTLAEQIQALQDRVERDEDKTKALQRMPAEPIVSPASDAPVVWFVKTWGNSAERYEYSAIGTPRGWLVSTDRKSGFKTWTELLMFALLREPAGFDPFFHIAKEWTRLER